MILNSNAPFNPTHILTAMEAEGKSPPRRHTRKRPSIEPHEPRAKRRAGATAVAVSMHPPPLSQQLDGIASSSASDGQSSTAGGMIHFCGHCQKRAQSPGKLAQHERVHATSDAAFYCSLCPKQFSCQSKVTRHERTHTGEKPYACSMCPSLFTQKGHVAPHERTHTGAQGQGRSRAQQEIT